MLSLLSFWRLCSVLARPDLPVPTPQASSHPAFLPLPSAPPCPRAPPPTLIPAARTVVIGAQAHLHYPGSFSSSHLQSPYFLLGDIHSSRDQSCLW